MTVRPLASLRNVTLAAATLMGFALASPAAALTTVLRVMLDPASVASGTLPDSAKARLDALIGATTSLAGFTRTGAVELTLPVALDDATAAVVVRRMREARGVLWAEVPRSVTTLAKSASADAASRQMGYRMMLKLAPGVVPDWASLLPQFAARIGVPLAVDRKVADVYMLSLQTAQTQATLAGMAAALEQHPAVQFADPVRRMKAMRTPNDPLLSQQWSLTDAVSGIGAEAAWSITTGSSSTTVAVIDTGILPHPDLDGRVLPGYDFISDPAFARDGDGRDANPRDEGTWNDAGDCDGAPARSSFWHGMFVAGLIAASGDNGIGVAGMNWNAQILPVRALGKCGEGTDADIFEAMMWSAGVPIDGVPLNTTPARVINLSLGGYGPCDSAVQEAVDIAISQGAVIVASAGNSDDLASNFAPGNCSGVINVGASSRTADLSSYSNFGARVDIVAPGGDVGSGDDGLMLSTFNDGTTVPGNAAYGFGAGTSFSAPLVSGTVSLMLARNVNLTAGRVQSIIQGSTRDFGPGTRCSAASLCGAGLLDAGLAVASTVPSSGVAPPGAVPVVEYYRSDLDHYFITASADEAAYMDAFLANVWQRTGGVFYAYASAYDAPPGAQPVCRYSAGGLINSNFWSADPSECAAVGRNTANGWTLDTPAAFWIQSSGIGGTCADGNVPVYRFFDNRRDANQRFTVDRSERRAMQNRAWVLDGAGSGGSAFCAPI
ncbi:MAG: S8 family peptidase [Casimicrobiaceae bacterium]